MCTACAAHRPPLSLPPPHTRARLAVPDAMNFVFGAPGCDSAGNSTLPPSRTLLLTPKSDASPCGYAFRINFR